MNKYIIVSVNKSEGRVGNDSNSLLMYFELGWEMVTTHLLCKRYYKEGKISKDDVIVTQKDRKFLYQSVFNNVISYEEYLEIKKSNQDISELNLVEKVLESCKNYFNLCYFEEYYTSNNNQNREYKYFNEDKEIITDFLKCDTTAIHNNKKYICFGIRKRDHASFRNMSDEWSFRLINELKNYINIFVVGKDSERFCDGVKVKHVNLQEYASLCSDPLCIANIGSLSGIMFIPGFFSKAKYNIIVDFGGSGDAENGYNSGHPLYLAKCVRYSESKFIINENNVRNIARIVLSEL